MCCGSNKGSGTVVWTAHLSLLLHITCLNPPSSPKHPLSPSASAYVSVKPQLRLLANLQGHVSAAHSLPTQTLSCSLSPLHTHKLSPTHRTWEHAVLHTESHVSRRTSLTLERGHCCECLIADVTPMAVLILLLPCHRGSPPEKQRAAKYRDNRESENRETDSRTDVLRR